MRRLFGLAIVLVVISGCSTLTVNQDFDPGVDFSAYRSYAWIEQDQSNISGLVAQRVVRAVNAKLVRNGMEEVPDNPDLLVTYYFGSHETINVSGSGYGYGSYFGAYGWGGGASSGDVNNVTWGNLIIDLVDAERQELVWRGSAKKAIDPNPTTEEMDAGIKDAVGKIFAQYPPSTTPEP